MATAVDPEDPQLAHDEEMAMEHYERSIRATIRPEDERKFLVVAVQSGDFEIDTSDYKATSQLKARRPDERLWLMRADAAPAQVFRSPRLLGP